MEVACLKYPQFKIPLFNLTSIDQPSIAIQYDKNIQENGAEIVLFRKLFDMVLFTESCTCIIATLRNRLMTSSSSYVFKNTAK